MKFLTRRNKWSFPTELVMWHHDPTPLSILYSRDASDPGVEQRPHRIFLCPFLYSTIALNSAHRAAKVPFTHESVKCENVGKLLHQLSNTGAERQFDQFLEEVITQSLPVHAESYASSQLIRALPLPPLAVTSGLVIYVDPERLVRCV